MCFDWKKYLELAKYMIEKADEFPDKEACYRTSSSRAYYAALNVVHMHIQNTDNIYFETNIHREIRRYLMEDGKSKIANQLKRLHKSRIQSDYHNTVEKPVNIANKALALSKKIINEIYTL